MSENKIAFPVKLASNNPQSFGIVDATEISGHRSVGTLSDLYSISDSVLSILKDGSDAIGQEWFVVSEDCKYRLDNWENRKTTAGWTKLPKQWSIDDKQSISEKDQPNGYAGLDSNGKVPIEKIYGTTATVVVVETYESLPAVGSSDKIYVTTDTNTTYYWTGATYVEISKPISLGETSSTAYRGDLGAIAYAHSQILGGTGVHVSDTERINWNLAYNNNHTHGDNDVLNHLSIVDGKLKADIDFYSIGEVSAFGAGSGTGGSGLTQTVYGLSGLGGTYSNATLTDTFNAYTINQLHARLLQVEAGAAAVSSTERTNWNLAYTNNHTHTNKSVLDGITSTLIANWNTAYTNSHTHTNKSLLDAFSQSDNNVLDHLSVVNGNLKVDIDLRSGWFRSDGTTGWLNDTYGGGIYMTDTTYVRVYNSKSFWVNNNIVATGEITAFGASDIRLKSNIKQIDSALDFLGKVKTYEFDWNEKALSLNPLKAKRGAGVIAQEMSLLDNNFVHSIYGDYLGVDYERFIPYLIGGVNELSKKMYDYGNRLDRAEKRVAELELEVKRLIA